MSLAFKYTLSSIILIFGFSSVFTLVSVEQESEAMESMLIKEAVSYCNMLEKSVAENFAALRLDRVKETTFFLKQNPSIEYAYVIDIDGLVVSDGTSENKFKYQRLEDPFHKKAINSDSILVQQNKDFIDVSRPIEFGSEKIGYLRIGFSKAELVKTQNHFNDTALILAVIFTFAGSLLTFLVIRRISEPLSKLTDLTISISKGDFEEKLIVKTNDEISTLADSFNLMTEKLSEMRYSLLKAKEEAEKSNELKSEFLAQISHEIRTPINTLLNYASLIEEEIREEANENNDSFEYIDIMKNAGKRITRTIDLILNMSELQKGNYSLEITEFDIYLDLMLNLFYEFKESAKKKNLNFTIINNLTKSAVKADHYSTTQIFQNLIDNAIKYTSTGFVKLELDNSGNNIIVSIIDSGEGISEEFQK